MLKWKNESHPLVKGQWQILEDHFLVVAANDYEVPLSGCSMDALRRQVDKAGAACGIDFLNRLLYYREPSGEIRGIDRSAFKDAVVRGEITQATPVFNTMLDTVGSIQQGQFEVPVKDCWHDLLWHRAKAM